LRWRRNRPQLGSCCSPEEKTSARNGTTLIFQIVRFLRPNILFYDGQVIDLYQFLRALYLVHTNFEEAMKRGAI